MDLEDEIDLFCVRKYNTNFYPDDKIRTKNVYKIKEANNYKEKVLNYIPLMIKHVQTLNDSCIDKTTNVTKAFNGKIRFKNCVLYGKIMCKTKETKTNYSYLLDDGTGSLNIVIFRKTNEEETTWKMENELESVKNDTLSQNKKEIVKSLRNLLLKTKEQLDNSNIPMGSKVFVYGKPSYYRNQTVLETYYVTQDVKTDRDIEITFKDCLIEWYNTNILQD